MVVGELAINRVLHGQLPRPSYPAALRANAPKVWWGIAEMVFSYASANHARYGRMAQCTGLLAQAASQSAHAVLAARGEWVTNEKTLLTRADLREVDQIIAAAQAEPHSLRTTVDMTRALCAAAVRAVSDG